MVKMPGSHNAENFKKAIEIIINKLNFNKAKISAVVTDEGSNLLFDSWADITIITEKHFRKIQVEDDNTKLEVNNGNQIVT